MYLKLKDAHLLIIPSNLHIKAQKVFVCYSVNQRYPKT